MKVFLSWSGDRSKQLAEALHSWLPLVLHYVEPWLSQADVQAGSRWADVIAAELNVSNFGIICVTPENLTSPWVLFEAGALAKSMADGRVVPVLLDLELQDVAGPLAQFQAKKYEKVGLFDVVKSIQASCTEEVVADDRLHRLFDLAWPDLEKQVRAMPAQLPDKAPRPQGEVLEELVVGVRGLEQRFLSMEKSTLDEVLSIRGSLDELKRMLVGVSSGTTAKTLHPGSDPQPVDDPWVTRRGTTLA